MAMMFCDENGQNAGQWVTMGESVKGELLQKPLVSEYREKFSFPFGDAELVQIIMPNIAVIYGDLMLRQSGIRMWSSDRSETVELHFCITGMGNVRNDSNGHTYVFAAQQQNIIYVPAFDGVGDFSNSGKEGYKFFEVHFTSSHFIDLVKDSCDTLQRFTEYVAAGKSAELSPHGLPINLDMQQCLNDIMNCKFQGGLKQLYLQAKCVELLSLQAFAFEQSQQSAPKSVLRSGYEKERIMQVRDYLLEHMENPPSLLELSKVAGLNSYKLKNGFKEIFNTTVYGYLNDVKLTQAKEQLLSGISIKEIALELGYGSVQHFSKAYRNKFGMPPGKSRQS